jgi:hypothetical protein
MADEPIPVVTRLESAEDKELREHMAKLVLGSPEQLDSAARQVIALVAGLYSVIFGVLAFAGDPVPKYLAWPIVRGLGIAMVAALGLSLVASLIVIFPFRYRYSSRNLTQQEDTFNRILRRKSGWLIAAAVLFAVGLLALGTLLVYLLLYIS